jgi:hypothetical protein
MSGSYTQYTNVAVSQQGSLCQLSPFQYFGVPVQGVSNETMTHEQIETPCW